MNSIEEITGPTGKGFFNIVTLDGRVFCADVYCHHADIARYSGLKVTWVDDNGKRKPLVEYGGFMTVTEKIVVSGDTDGCMIDRDLRIARLQTAEILRRVTGMVVEARD